MLVLSHASFAEVEQLFQYKKQGFILDGFPGYTPNQWGIKAHNRPWVEENGRFASGQKIIEVGGAYSLLPKYLAEKYNLEAWIGDDFGDSNNETIWSRWGSPRELPVKHPSVNYIFQPFGIFSNQYPDQYFDRIFTISTLEHIPQEKCLDVLRDMHRCLKPGGIQIHTIDIGTKILSGIKNLIFQRAADESFIFRKLFNRKQSDLKKWISLFKKSGVRIDADIPKITCLMNRKILVEGPDVVYQFYHPNNEPKHYWPSASLLLIIESC